MLIALLIILAVLSLVLAPLTLWYARKVAMVDVANQRSSHSGVVLRGGGLLFIVVFYVGMVALSLYQYALVQPYMVLILSALVIAILSWFDDRYSLSARLRFSVQLIVVITATLSLPQVLVFLPYWLSVVVVILAWMWFINLYNFMDGADGFAAQQGIVIALALACVFAVATIPMLILTIGLLGFLTINYPKAKIFMGDIGSTFLGFLFAGLLFFAVAHGRIDIFQALALTSLFGYDATYTLIKRALQRKKVWQAHREHWYQRLLISGYSHQQLFWVGMLYNVVIIVALLILPTIYAFVFSLIWFVLYTLFILCCEKSLS